MKAGVAFPFRTITDESVEFAGWRYVDEDGLERLLGEQISPWDYEQKLYLQSDLEINFDKAFEDIGLPVADATGELSQLRVYVLLSTGTGRLGRKQLCVFESTLDADEPSVRIAFEIPSSQLANKFRIELMIVLGEEWEESDLITPFREGSKLWGCQSDVRIEGGGTSLFPMETVSFRTAFRGRPWEKSLWYLDWDPSDLHADFSGSTRLLLNSDNVEFVERVQNQDKLLCQALMASIVNQMLTSVLHTFGREELEEEFEQDTLGSQVKNWCSLIYGEFKPRVLKEISSEKPNQFDAAILATFEQE